MNRKFISFKTSSNSIFMYLNKLMSTTALLFMCTLCYAQVVNNQSQLNSAINSATPGATIILANGTWNNTFIDLDKNGTSGNPITITAQNPESVLMTGNSRVYMEGNYLTVSGLVFQDPSNLVVDDDTIEPIFELRDCDNCKVLNNKIDTYNGTESQKTLKFKWILADGQNNEIAYNSFLGKYGVGSIINDNRNSPEADFLSIHHNYFADRTPINELNEDNDQDAIRIGNSSTSLDDSFTEVYNNFFHNFFGEIEVISNKSGENKYYNNTFRDYAGTLTLRHGNNCEVFGNYFFAENNTFSGGIRVIGENHKVYNNYIEGVNSTKPDGSQSNATAGINVSNGRENSALNGYYQVKNTEIVNNTFVNCDFGLRIGTSVSSDLDEEPVNLTIGNNIMFNCDDPYEIETSPSGSSTTSGNIPNLQNGVLIDDGNFHRLMSGSLPVGAGTGNYTYLTNDVLNGNRDSDLDAGAEEFGSNGTNFPYIVDDVGVSVGFGAISSNLSTNATALEIGVCAEETTFEIVSNVDWTISENLDWLSLDATSGSGSTVIIATITENTTGSERSGNITITENGGGLTTTLSVIQLIVPSTDEVNVVATSSVGMQMEPDIAEINAYNDDLTNYWTGNPDTDPEVAITFDLGQSFILNEIGIHFWKANERTTTFSISIAADAAGPFTTVVDNGVSEMVGAGVEVEQIFPFNPTEGRFVKFTGHGNSSATNWTSIANVNIYGEGDCNAAPPISTSDIEVDLGISVFPVPTINGTLNIASESKPLQVIDIYEVTGRHILSINGNGNLSKQINVSEFSPGIYLMILDGIGEVRFLVE